jgi:hypothetical protein
MTYRAFIEEMVLLFLPKSKMVLVWMKLYRLFWVNGVQVVLPKNRLKNKPNIFKKQPKKSKGSKPKRGDRAPLSY